MLSSRVIYDHRQQTYLRQKRLDPQLLWQKNVSRNATAERYVYILHSLLSIAVCLIKGKNEQLPISFGDINVKALEQRKAAFYQIRN